MMVLIARSGSERRCCRGVATISAAAVPTGEEIA
jgi:hypothetical protein